ncbi:19673_t:CDS:10 [Entrophospora sp. SA101]|nr:19673_t:CDS:10 [Entrophospora sp. SA101]CAJ0881577.1 1647_t:CDS:10 [Entrophospora sp. SA101]
MAGMAINLIHLDEVSIVAAILGSFIICFGLVSFFVKEKLHLSEASLKIFDPNKWENTDEVTLGFTRIAMSIQVMFSGVALPKAYLFKEMKSLFVLLTLVMTYMWLVSGLLIWGLIPNLSFLESLAIAVCITPTDPILANSVVKGRFAEKHVPIHVRNILSAESASNDGLAYPFFYLIIFLLNEPSVGTAIGKWILLACLYQVALSIVIGIVVGQLIDKQSFLVFAIALAFFVMGFVSIIGSNEFLACFVAGAVFSWDDWFRRETEEAHLQEVIDMLLNLAIFVYIGAIIPWSTFVGGITEITLWRLFVCSILILLFRRLPAIVALMHIIPAIKTYREAVFTGWFGPIGIGAIYYAIKVKNEISPEGKDSLLKDSVEPALVKISKRINTRTQTTGSLNNQVSRLPVINFGTQILFKNTKTNEQESSNDSATISVDTNLDQDEEQQVEEDNKNQSQIDDDKNVKEKEKDSDDECIIWDEKNNYVIENHDDDDVQVIAHASTSTSAIDNNNHLNKSNELKK